MLQEALKVVEAARLLGLLEKNGKTFSPLTHLELATNLEGLRRAIEAFDNFVALGQGELGDNHTPGFAAPPQLADEGFASPSLDLTPKFFPGEFDDMEGRFKDKDLEAEAELKKKDADLKAIEERIVKAIMVPASRRIAKFGQDADYSDLSDNLLCDGDDTVGDFLLAIDRIDDKLGLYASKHGWNPRLRKLAHAVLEMRKRLVLEVKEGGVYLRIPAHVFSSITVAIADAVVDRDMSMMVPELRARVALRKDLDEDRRFDNLPKQKMI